LLALHPLNVTIHLSVCCCRLEEERVAPFHYSESRYDWKGELLVAGGKIMHTVVSVFFYIYIYIYIYLHFNIYYFVIALVLF
jgi:hypothetical protein